MEKVKEIVKKFGGYIALGAFGLTFISVFLSFVSVSFMGISVSASLMDDGAWGWIVMLLSLVGAAIIAIELFKKDLFDKVKNNIVELLINYLPLGLAGFIFIVTLVEGIQAKTSGTHWSIGFYFLILGSLAAGAVVVIKRIVMKELFKFDGVSTKPENK